MEKEKITNEEIEIFTTYYDVANVATGEKDYEKRTRIYSQKSARNYEEMKKKYDNCVVNYMKNGEIKNLNELIKIDFSKLNPADLSQMLDFTQKLNERLDTLKVKSAKVIVRQDKQTGNILTGQDAEILVELC